MKYLLILLFFATNTFAQNVSLDITDLSRKKDRMGITLTILNNSDIPVTIYRPEVKDICCNIFKIKFINGKDLSKYEVFPCDKTIDLEFFTLDYTNSVYLKQGESFVKRIEFSLKDVSPFLVNGERYSMRAELNMKGVNFKTDLKSIYCRDLASNKINVVYHKDR